MSRPQRLGELLAHIVAEHIGAWTFVLWQTALMSAWFIYNAKAPVGWRFDPPPYLLGNIIMSVEAAFTGPIVLIATNYHEKRRDALLHRMEKLLLEMKRG